MKDHGLFSVAKSASVRPPGQRAVDFATVSPHRPDDRLIGSGFRHFLHKPSAEEAFRFNGQPIDRRDQHALRTALAKLSYALENAGGSIELNPSIPSGYGYLMQFIAHDLVASASSLARIDNGRMALDNNRTTMLRLESIYAGGPEGSPFLYVPSPTRDCTTPNAPTTSLRLGPLDTGGKFSCPYRDLARIDVKKATQDVDAKVNKSPLPPPPFSVPDVVVGDPRNDDHAIISQLTVVFHLLHNGLVTKTAGMPTHSRYTEAAFNQYFYARMAATLIFRNVIRLDVMKRFLHPEVYSLYNVGDPPFVDGFEDAVPLELTHGALRVCHSMLRDGYTFNERASFTLHQILLKNSVNSPSQMPLPDDWVAAWSFFFDIDGQPAPANTSVRLGPHYASILETVKHFPPIDDVQVGDKAKSGLAYRDMVSSALAGLWSVPALIKHLAEGQSPQADLVKAWPLADRAGREKALEEWMVKYQLPRFELTPAELKALANDPPLPFFLMFEALEDDKGAHFGVLGSIIVAEAIFGILHKDPLTPDQGLLPLDKALEDLGRDVFGNAELPEFPRLDTMADVIGFVADMHGLQDAQPRFI